MNHREALTIEQLQAIAPSAFAGQPYEKQSKRYTFIPTTDVIEGMQDAGYVPVAASQSRTKVEGKQYFTKHMLRFRPEASLNQEAVVGELVPEAVFINAHDGTSAYKMFFGVYRFTCTNGMMVSDSVFESVSIRHTGDVVREAIESTHRVFEEAPKVLGAIKTWQGIELTTEEQIDFAQAAHMIRFPYGSQTDVTPEMLLRSRRYTDEGNSLWLTFNRVQENAIKGINSKVVRLQTEDYDLRVGLRRARSTKAIRGIDQDVKLNRGLWSLAEAIAASKA